MHVNSHVATCIEAAALMHPIVQNKIFLTAEVYKHNVV